MSFQLRLIFAVLMPLALIFGFFHLFLPESDYNYERLHVFLFNLCSGGTIILYYTEGVKRLTVQTCSFLVLSLVFAVSAFLEVYEISIVIACILSVIVERIRVKEFSMFPIGFFKIKEPIYRKFHQASLLCLSIALILSSLVTINNNLYQIVDIPKLSLDTFYLGFSFPVSLITMSVIFSMINEQSLKLVRGLKEVGFWAVNLGVIIFFCFIIINILIPQVVITIFLFIAVIMILSLFYRYGKRMQQKSFLISGLFFLLASAITGFAYIALEITDAFDYSVLARVLRLHAFFSLYGWNLCGLAVICRFYDFPIQLHSKSIVAIHWFTIVVAGTLGSNYLSMAVLAVTGYIVILYLIFFSRAAGSYPKPAAPGK